MGDAEHTDRLRRDSIKFHMGLLIDPYGTNVNADLTSVQELKLKVAAKADRPSAHQGNTEVPACSLRKDKT